MPQPSKARRVFILGNPDKPGVQSAIEEVHTFAKSGCDVVGCALSVDGTAAVDAAADYIVVLGGDGTLLAVCRSLGIDQIPLIGVNFGKLGYLAEFSVDEFKRGFDDLIANDDLVSERAILTCCVQRSENTCFESVAVNDCVVQAGPPFRMIDLSVSVNDHHLTTITGDGLIVCTPVGSTAYNLSAGGPIMQGGVMGIAITPLSPHSLTHRPVVVEYDSKIDITINRANSGSTLLIDGQINAPLEAGDRVCVQRFSSPLLLVRNPANPKWHGLVTKLRWGLPPSYK